MSDGYRYGEPRYGPFWKSREQVPIANHAFVMMTPIPHLEGQLPARLLVAYASAQHVGSYLHWVSLTPNTPSSGACSLDMLASFPPARYHLRRLVIENPGEDIVPDVTRILSNIEQGDPDAAEQLLPLVYEELRKLAAAKMAQENPGQTLQATALVHEAYLRLVDVEKAQHWNSRGHFFCAAAEAMRRILVEQARRKHGPRRGGGVTHVKLDDAHDIVDPRASEILHVHDALEGLARESPAKAELVKLRYYGGLSHQEAADALGLSRATADRYWAYAKAYLFAAMQDHAE